MHFTAFVSGALCASLALSAALPARDLSSLTSTTSSAPEGKSGAGSKGGYDWSDVGKNPSYGDKCGYITEEYAKEVIDQFTTDGIIPDLIEGNVFWHPTVKVNVAYGSKAVDLGTYFTTLETLAAPTLNFTAEKGFDPYKTKYIYFLLDPDVPQDGSPVQVTYEHWAVANAQPFCVTDQQPETLVVYQPLTPASTTQHRYTFLVYRQPEDFDPEAVKVQLQLRTPFDINDFAEKYNLTIVGGNFLKEAITNGLQNGDPTTTPDPLPTL